MVICLSRWTKAWPGRERLRFWFLFANSGAWEYSINKHLFIELLLCAQHCEGHKEALICKTTDQNLSMQMSSLPREVGLLTGPGRLALFEELLLPAPSPNDLDFSPTFLRGMVDVLKLKIATSHLELIHPLPVLSWALFLLLGEENILKVFMVQGLQGVISRLAGHPAKSLHPHPQPAWYGNDRSPQRALPTPGIRRHWYNANAQGLNDNDR